MLLLVPLALVAVEVFAFVEVAGAIGWIAALLLLLATSALGGQLLRYQGRRAIERVSVSVSERRAPGRAALDGALGVLGALLLVVPGFVTDALGVVLLAPPSQALARRWLSRHYTGRAMRFVATSGRFAPRPRGRPGDVDSTAVDVETDALDP
jgi:UPF0716 protein FxsA